MNWSRRVAESYAESANPADLADWARRAAGSALDVPELRESRWRHVQGVGAKAEVVARAFGEEGPRLVAAAWLHDIGYAPGLRLTGFHHLDGARAVAEWTSERRLAALIANHSGGAWEAPMIGLEKELIFYPDEHGAVRDALWVCDMTTSPAGEPVNFEQRLSEIATRYGPEHSVPRSITEAAGEIRAAIARTRERVTGFGIDVAF